MPDPKDRSLRELPPVPPMIYGDPPQGQPRVPLGRERFGNMSRPGERNGPASGTGVDYAPRRK